MKKLLGTTAIGLALAVSPAMAGDQTDVNQVMNAIDPQNALNTATAEDVLNFDQTASNLGNFIDVIGNFDDIDQDLAVDQRARNVLDAGGTSIKEVTQDASNAANIVDIIDGTTGDIKGDLEQTFEARGDRPGDDTQKATNRLLLDDQGQGGDILVRDYSQSASNLGNYANIDDAGSVLQKFAGNENDQRASNFIGGDNDSSAGDPGRAQDVENRLQDVSQDASNSGNLLLADDVGSLDQLLGQSVDQFATNTAWYELDVQGTEQSASNTANYADVNAVDGLALQKTGDESDQVARNVLMREPGQYNGDGWVRDTSQSATNYANIFRSVIDGVDNNNFGDDRPEQDKKGNETRDPNPDVDQLEQDGGDAQRASNKVTFGAYLGKDNGKFRPDTTQDATNIMNLAEVREFDEGGISSGTLVMQTAAGADDDSIQSAVNLATYSGSSSLSEPGNVRDFEQSAGNMANLVYTGNLPSITSSSGVTEFDQTVSVPQFASNTITTIGNLNGVTQGASNVGNVLSDLD